MMITEQIGAVCRYCNETHGPRCPWIKAIEFDTATGRVKRVELFGALDFPPPTGWRWMPATSENAGNAFPGKPDEE